MPATGFIVYALVEAGFLISPSRAGEIVRLPDGLPFKSWGELKEGEGGDREGRVLEIYGEQGASWKIEGTSFDFVPFLAMGIKHSDEPEQYWNNYWKPIVGARLQGKFSSPKNEWYSGIYGIQVDANIKSFTSGSPQERNVREVEAKIIYSFQGDWLKR
jgi:hypothetical protein